MTQIRHETLNEKAYLEIKNSIMSGQVAPGEVLRIRNLAIEYGVSPTPVREALKQLVAEHALEVLPNRSIVVPQLTRTKFQELTKIRLALEGLAGELAASKADAKLPLELERLDKRMHDATKAENARLYLRLNEEFHFTLYQAGDSPSLLNFIEVLWLQVGPFLNNLFKIGRFQYDANECHGEIIAALRRGNAEAVGQSVQHDIAVSSEHLIKFL
ncbi:MAG: GntR family transcriptional regulator [Rhodospirillaceae bacterium]|nr:GntR family transcriptional regulator [Rhodospirillaceae bacterium]